MKNFANKKTFILLIGTFTLITAVVVPAVLFSKKNESITKEKDIVSYGNKLKKLSTKEVTISASSGSVTDNKNAILKAIKKLSDFPKVPSGINLEVKDDATNLTLAGISITLILKQEGETNLEVLGFIAKRSQSDQEKYVEKLKNFSVKEVTINVTSGDVSANKNAILNAIKALNNFPKVPSGINLEVKDDTTILNEQWAQITLIVKKQGKTDLEVTGFKVKRSQSDQEIVDAYFNQLNILPTKEVTITGSSGNVTANKNAILGAIKTLNNFPTTPSGINLEVKDDATNLTLAGVPVTLIIKKGIITKEISGFKAKRSLLAHEEYANKLKVLPTKEVTINETSGSVTDNKNSIKTQVEALANFPVVPSGVSWEVKDAATLLTPDGIDIILVVKKGSLTKEVRGFRAKRSQSDQEIADDYKVSFKVSFNVSAPGARFKLPYIKIDSESGTIEENKDVIINKIKNSYDFIFPPTGFDIRLKPDQNQEITLAPIPVDIEIFKIDTQNTFASIDDFLEVKRSQTQSEFESSNYESIKNHFSINNNKNIGIPFESISKTYTQLTKEALLEAVKKALIFNDSVFWTKTLLDKISLKDNSENRAITNFDSTQTITIEYGPNDDKSEVNLQISKYSKIETITKYFEYGNNTEIIIPFNVANSSSANSILEKVKDVLLYKNIQLWQTLKNFLFVNRNKNKLNTLEHGDEVKEFKIKCRTNDGEKNITLELWHYSIAQQIEDYFDDEYNEQNRMINIPSITLSSDLNTADKILEKIKVYLSIKDTRIWKPELQNNIRISPSNKMTSLVKGDLPKPFIIEYTKRSSKQTIMLKLKHL